MIFRDQKFAPLFWTQFFGALNDNLFKTALVLLLAYQNIAVLGLQPSALVAFAGGIFVLPFFLFSPLAGQICDKFEKSSIVRITKWWELAIMVVGAVGFYFDSYTALLFVLFLMGTQSAFFGPLKYSMIPDLVDRSKLLTGNAYIETGTFIAILVGTIVGGLLVTTNDHIISMSIIGVAGIGVLSAYRLMRVDGAEPDLKIAYNPIPTIGQLWKLIREKSIVFRSIVAISWFWFFGAAILSVLPVFCKDTLGVDEHVVTLFLAMFTIGIGVGSFVCDQVSKGQINLVLVPFGAVGMTVFLAGVSMVEVSWQIDRGEYMNLSTFWQQSESSLFSICFFLMSVFAGIFILPLYTLIQERTTVTKRSRVIAGLNIFNAFFMVVSSVMVMGFYGWGMNPSQIFMTLAGMNIIAAVLSYIGLKV